MTSPEPLLFDFREPDVALRFIAVDDRIMGGVSRSRLKAEAGHAAFEGELSLDAGGGFASVRSAPSPVDLTGRTGIALRVRGDGRRYRLRVRTDEHPQAVSYQAAFDAPDASWSTVRLPFARFEPTFRGEPRPNAKPLDPGAVSSFGLLVADRQAGAFRLEIESITAYGSA